MGAEYGTPDELPNIHHRKQYLAEADVMPDYRITCIFVDKRYRRQSYAKVALDGALDLIAAEGGGVVEGYPHEIGEKRMNNSFVYNGTRANVRASWLRVRPLQGNEEHRHAPHDRTGLSLRNPPWVCASNRIFGFHGGVMMGSRLQSGRPALEDECPVWRSDARHDGAQNTSSALPYTAGSGSR